VISVTVFLAWRNGPLVSDIVPRTSSIGKGVKRVVTLVDWRRAEGLNVVLWPMPIYYYVERSIQTNVKPRE